MDEFKKNIEILSRDLVYKGSVLEVYNDRVKINNRVANWDYVHQNNASAIIPVLPNGNILLVKQFRLAVSKITIELPAGKFNENDNPYDCAMRELEEETGYKTKKLDFLINVHTSIAFTNEIISIYVANNLEKGIVHNDEDEETLICEMSLKDIVNDIYNGKILDGKTVAGILAYVNKYKINI